VWLPRGGGGKSVPVAGRSSVWAPWAVDGECLEGGGVDIDAEPWAVQGSGPSAVSERDVLAGEIGGEDVAVVGAFDVTEAGDAAGELAAGGREQRRLARVAAELHAQARALGQGDDPQRREDSPALGEPDIEQVGR